MNSKIARTIFDKSCPGKTGYILPKTDVPQIDLDKYINKKLLKTEPFNMPELTEPEVVRHFVNLSTKNHHVDKDFYPLGSCTMKYNPKINDILAGLPGFSGMHPNQLDISSQGALQVMLELEKQISSPVKASKVIIIKSPLFAGTLSPVELPEIVAPSMLISNPAVSVVPP